MDIVELLKKNGYGVVEGADEVKRMIEMMEEMANAPREEFGKRTSGERGMYERNEFKE